MTERGKRERTRASTNDELIAEDADLRASNKDGNRDHKERKELAADFKNEAIRKLIAWDLTALNGPHDAQKDDPKPPYWEERERGKDPKDISDSKIKAALQDVEQERRKEERKSERQRLGK